MKDQADPKMHSMDIMMLVQLYTQVKMWRIQTETGTYDNGDNKSSTYLDLMPLPYS